LVNTTRGINGLVFDVAGLANSTLSAADFVFRVSPTGAFNEAANPPSSWASAAAPTLIDVTAGTETTPARIRLEWADNAIANRWLQIKLLANANTGLTQSQVFYVGHLLGETNGNLSGGVFQVSVADITAIRPNVGFAANVNSLFDLNKNGLVQVSDITSMRSFVGIGQLRLITIPPAGSNEEGENGIGGANFVATPSADSQKKDTAGDPNGVNKAPQMIRGRLTQENYDVPLPMRRVEPKPEDHPGDWIGKGDATVEAMSDTPVDLLSLDDYFAKLSRKRTSRL
jgi:hypothetical protein